MKIVADTSVIIAVLTNAIHKPAIIAKTQYADLIAPLSLHWEIGNAFSPMFKRDRITLEQALEALSSYNEIPIRFVDVDLQHSIALSKQFNMYAYDIYFIVCAQKENAALLTLDKKLVQVACELGIKTLEV